MKGLATLKAHVPEELHEYLDEKIKMTKMIAPYACKGNSGIKYDLCEAKIFITLNPELVEGLIAGRWEDFIEEISKRSVGE